MARILAFGPFRRDSLSFALGHVFAVPTESTPSIDGALQRLARLDPLLAASRSAVAPCDLPRRRAIGRRG